MGNLDSLRKANVALDIDGALKYIQEMKKEFPQSTTQYPLVNKGPLGTELKPEQKENFAIMHQRYDEVLVLVVATFLDYEAEALGDLPDSAASDMILCNFMFAIMTLYSYVLNKNKREMLEEARKKLGNHLQLADIEYVMLGNCASKTMDTVQTLFNAFVKEDIEKNGE